MRDERLKALEAFDEYIKAAKTALKDIKRLEQESPTENAGFDMLEKHLPNVQALERVLYEVRTTWNKDPINSVLDDPNCWAETDAGRIYATFADEDAPTGKDPYGLEERFEESREIARDEQAERDTNHERYSQERDALLAELDEKYGY